MSLFLRVFAHLLPRSATWSLTQNKTLRKFFSGLAAPLDDPDPSNSPRAFADAVFSDVFPATARASALAEWERQYGLIADPDDAVRRQSLASVWQATGGQSPGYIQGVLQTAGFPIYVHEWWSAGPPVFVARDPRTYTQHPSIGTYQCAPTSLVEYACAPFVLGQPQCNSLLGNEPGYLVNKDLTQRPPPAVPDDPATWPYFLYFGAETFPSRASVPTSRRAELERLVLKLSPNHIWLVMLVDYVADDSGAVTVGGVAVVAGGVPVVIAGASSVTAGGSAVTVGGVSVSASA